MNKVLLLFLFPFSLPAQIDTSKIYGTLPVSWDKDKTVSGKDGVVLAWVQKKDHEGYAFRTCIRLSTADSIGRIFCSVTQLYTDDPAFKEWEISKTEVIEEGYDDGNGHKVGGGVYWNKHTRLFDKVPAFEEIVQLINYWNFSLYADGWVTTEAGIDEVAWKKLFGKVPDKEFAIEK